MDAENEVVDSENDGAENDILPPEQKGHCLRNPTTINYNGGRANHNYMVGRNMIIGSHSLQNFSKAYVNIVIDITTFVEPTPPTNIITNDTILTQYIIKQGLKNFEKRRGCSTKIIATVSQPQSCRVKDASRPQYEQQGKILTYPMLLKLKNGKIKIKGRG